MELHILRDGEQLGPFSLSDARQHFADGALLCTDLARHEGLISWAPINQILYEPLPVAPPPLAPPPEWERFFEQKVDHSGHLTFADEILKRHTFDAASSAKYRARIKSIRERSKDYFVYMAVVGQFSAGKSTFINALMKRDLLSRDVLQGTTVSATFIRFGSHFVDEVYFEDGQVKRHDSIASGEFAAAIHEVTAVEKNAAGVKRVNLNIRSRCILQNVVLIDTPGLNTDNRRHADVTQSVVQNDADLAIIVTDSIAPLSMVLTQFLHANIEDAIARCLIALTKVDMLDTDDQRRVFANVKKRYLSEFGLSHALVLPVSPLALLAQLKPKTYLEVRTRLGDEMVDKYTAAFIESENQLSNFVEKYRWGVVAERVLRLLERLLNPLIEDVAKLKRCCESQLALAGKEQNVYLDSVVQAHLATLRAEFIRARESAQSETDRFLSYKEQELKTNVSTQLNAAQDVDTLHNAAKNSCTVFSPCSNELRTRLSQLASAASEQVNQSQAKLARDVQKHFPFIAALNTKSYIAQSDSNLLDVSKFSQHLASLQSSYQALQTSNNGAGGGGVAAGAALGTWLIPIPVVGTILGGYIGYHVGKSMNQSDQPPIQQKRNDYKRQIDLAFTELFLDVKRKARTNVAHIYNSSEASLVQHLDQYCNIHRDTINRKINSSNETKRQLQNQYQLLTSDLADLETRRAAVFSAREHLPDFV
jgi:ribosome biogenesis GTPase A